MKKKKYLVTGGTGFIGSALVKNLLARGHAVRVFDDNSRGNPERLASHRRELEYVEGDICDPQRVAQACAGIDSVCHLAAINGTDSFYSQPHRILEVGVKGMMNVLDGCLKHQVEELLLMSSSEVYQSAEEIPTNEKVSLQVPDPLNPRYSYGGGKIISELLALNYGRHFFKKVLVVRPHNVYGPDMGDGHVIPQFLKRMVALKAQGLGPFDFPIQGEGQESRAFIHIDDFMRGLELVLERGSHLNIYHVGSADEIKIADLVHELSQIMGLTLKVQGGDLRPGSTLRRCPDIGKMRALGFVPKINLREGLAQTAEWYGRP